MPTTGSWTFQSSHLLWLPPVTCWPMMIANHLTAPFAMASERWLPKSAKDTFGLQ